MHAGSTAIPLGPEYDLEQAEMTLYLSPFGWGTSAEHAMLYPRRGGTQFYPLSSMINLLVRLKRAGKI